MKYDVFGIGNPLVDLIFRVDNDMLVELDLAKGIMHPLDEDSVKNVLKRLEHDKAHIAPGDSTANTLAGIANLGGKVCFCGKVGIDEHGLYYEKTLNDGGVSHNLAKCSLMTGKAITLITPDTERTFAVHLGAAAQLEKEDVFEHEICQSKFLHLTGYQLEDPKLKETAIHAMELAKNHQVKISIDLADPNLVKRNKKDLVRIVKKYAHIVFANEKEAEALTGRTPEEALNELSKMADIAIVKIGENGSLIKKGSEFHRIEGIRVSAVDTTGAGDMYAAGILYGLTHGYSLEKAGKLASYAAAKVVEQVGARLKDKIKVPEI